MMKKPDDGSKESVAEPGEIADKPDSGEIIHINAPDFHVIRWGKPEDGEWIRADDSDVEHLGSKV